MKTNSIRSNIFQKPFATGAPPQTPLRELNTPRSPIADCVAPVTPRSYSSHRVRTCGCCLTWEKSETTSAQRIILSCIAQYSSFFVLARRIFCDSKGLNIGTRRRKGSPTLTYAFKVKESINGIPTKLPCLNDLENLFSCSSSISRPVLYPLLDIFPFQFQFRYWQCISIPFLLSFCNVFPFQFQLGKYFSLNFVLQVFPFLYQLLNFLYSFYVE